MSINTNTDGAISREQSYGEVPIPPLTHSFSQPELYYPPDESGTNTDTSLDTSCDTSCILPSALDHDQSRNLSMNDTQDTNDPLLIPCPPQQSRSVDTSFNLPLTTDDSILNDSTTYPHQLSPPPGGGPSTYQFDTEDTGATAILSSPTMAQHRVMHQLWKAEHRAERAAEAEAEEERQASMREGESSPMLRPTLSPTLKSLKTVRRRVRSSSDSSDSSDDDSDTDSEELPQLSPIELIGLCLPAMAVMLGWAVGEALLLPYLLSLGVSPTVANFAFLINPLFGLFLQPFFGRLSDQCTLTMGRRRPFLLLFCLGSVIGLTTVVWSAELTQFFSNGRFGEGSILHVIFVFAGFATMDLSHDLLLMPARALLNDRLPDEQTDQGNAYFASISSVGTCIGLTLTIVPLERYFPWSMLVEPLRATFTTATIIILACNICTLFISSGLDKPFEPDTDLDQIEGAGEPSPSPTPSPGAAAVDELNQAQPGETSRLLSKDRNSYGSQQHRNVTNGPLGEVSASPIPPTSFQHEVINVVDDSPDTPSSEDDEKPAESKRWLCFPENPLHGIIDAFALLPRPLKFIWILQLVWWYCVLHVNLWWTSWMVIELYGAPSPEESASHHHHHQSDTTDPSVAIRLATIGLLVQAVISFPSSASLPFFNRFFGITNWYHYSAMLYGLSVVAIGFVSAYYQTVIIMAVLGLAIPPIFSSSYILVEVYAAEALEDEDETEGTTSKSNGTPKLLPFKSLEHSPTLEGQSSSTSHRTLTERRPSDLQLPPRRTASPIFSPASVTSSRRPSRSQPGRSVAGTTSPSEGEESEFTTATLDDNRGTITALFNVTMICSQLVVGLLSGFLIDWIGNISIVFYVSGSVLVATNALVLFFRLSKPPVEVEEEEEEEETLEERIKEAARQQQKKRIEQLERLPQSIRTPHPPTSPPLEEYLESYETIPHITIPPPKGQYVRPLGEGANQPPRRHVHPHPTRNVTLKRSMSAPDVHLAIRALRKSRPKVKPVAVRVALFQPHRMTLGMRRDLLRGNRPKVKNVREMDSDAGSLDGHVHHHPSHEMHDVTRQQMREAHNTRLEKERVDKLRERVRLFGIKVATKVAQIKATRAKLPLKGSSATGKSNTASGPKRNNLLPRSSTHTTVTRPSADLSSSSTTALAPATSSFSASRPLASLDESKSFDTSNFFTDNASGGRVLWSMETAGYCESAASQTTSSSTFIPLPLPDSQQEAELIQRLAEQSVEREQQQLEELAARTHGLVDTETAPTVLQLPLVLPPIDPNQPATDPLLLLNAVTTPSVLHTPPHGRLMLEQKIEADPALRPSTT